MRNFLFLAASVFAAVCFAPPTSAHEGHEHDKPPPLSLPIAPRVIAVTPDYELVGVLSGDRRLTIFFHSFATGEPVQDAALTLSVGEATTAAKLASRGVYEVSAPWIAEPGPHDITFNLTLPGGADILTGRFERPEATISAAPAATGIFSKLGTYRNVVLSALGALMVGVLLGLLAAGRRNRSGSFGLARSNATAGVSATGADGQEATQKNAEVKALRRAGAAALAFGISLAGFSQIDLAEAADVIPELPATMATDMPQRLPDGTLFVPKATQHLLSLRTVLTAAEEAPRTTELLGLIVANPSGLGRVQATQAGRLEAPLGGMPHLGRKVKQGEIVALLSPTSTALDRSKHENEKVELDSLIEVARKKYERLASAQGVVRQRDIEEAKAELDGLVQRRTNHSPALRVKEEIRAPISGVISATTVVPGQIVEARETLFEIVDPSEFWVEAIAYDPTVVETMTAAHAVTAKGETLPLEFIGRSFELRQQAIPLSFRVKKESTDLALGKPVTVVLQASEKVQGFVLPGSSIVRGLSGLPTVWIKAEPERFEPQIVKFEKLDGQRVVVSAGLEPDQRVVTDGVTLINQIR
jgi:cobalt-zinc-cadmium efflux system membrane fusion protein